MEDSNGTNHAMIYMYANNTAPYVSLFGDGVEKLKTTTTGVYVTGTAEASTYLRAPAVTTDVITCKTGQQLVLNAGETAGQATGQTSEVVYVNAEGGLQVNSSPDNWTSGWGARKTAHIVNAAGDSSFPGNVDATGRLSASNHFAESVNGAGYKLWGTASGSSYSLHMSSRSDTTWGGAMAIAPTSDYNIYLRNSAGGTNRGFVFQDSSLDTKAQITGDGDLYVKGDIISPNSNRVVAKYRTTSGSGDRVLIETPFVPADNLMTRFTIDLYSSYRKDTYEVSGYAYASVSNWYLPKCIYRGDNAETPDIIFGTTAAGKMYVSLAANAYLGVTVHSLMVTYNGDDTDYQNTDWSISRSNTVVNQIAHETNDLSKPPVYSDSAGNRALVLTAANGNTDYNAILYKDAGTSLYFNTSNNTLVSPTFSGALSGNAATASKVAHSINGTDGTAYPILWGTATSTTQAFSCADVTIQSSNGRISAGQLKLAGLGVLRESGARSGVLGLSDSGDTWQGYGIEQADSRWQLMGSDDNMGIYEDIGNKWYVYCTRNGAVDLRYNNSSRITTTDIGVSVTGSVSATSAVLSNQAAYVAPNFGHGIFGTYSATRYQHVWSMGTNYKTSADGTSYGNMYGLTYTHTNIGTGTNQAISGLAHQLQGRTNGALTWALGTGIWTSGNVTAYSDRAVKTNLEVIPNALDKVKSISGYTYDRTDFEVDPVTGEMPDTRQAGVIAQEVEKILPEVVNGEEGNKAVAYGNMVALLIEAVKELSAEVDALKAGK